MLKSVDAQVATSFLSLKPQKCTNSRGGLSFGTAKALRAEQTVRQGRYQVFNSSFEV